jgi:hypothetical protein
MIERTLGFGDGLRGRRPAAGPSLPEGGYENGLYTGDEIKLKILPARDGSPAGFLKTVTMPDGRVIQISAGNPND